MDADLAEDVETNLVHLLRYPARLPGATLDERAGFSRISSSYDNAYFNAVFRPGEGLDLDEQIAWFGARRVPAFFVWTRDPSPLVERLVARGFAEDFTSSPGMAARMADLDWPMVAGIEVHRLDDTSRFADFAAVFCTAYDLPPRAAQQWLEATVAYGDAAPWTLHLAYAGGVPAAISMGVPSGRILGLYCIATVPAARGRRLGAAVTFAACAAGREVGCDRAVLFASALGEPLYARMGFRRVPIAFTRHKWSFESTEPLTTREGKRREEARGEGDRKELAGGPSD